MLTPVAEWHAVVNALVRPLPARRLPLAEAEGCILAEPVRTLHALPPFDSSAMDGYAVRADDLYVGDHARPVALRVIGCAPAGRPTDAVVSEGEAVRILTGGRLPAGADAVVPVEATDGGRVVVRVQGSVATGQHVRRAGEDLGLHGVVLAEGWVIGPGQAAAAAAAGHADLLVTPRPRVAVISTGDELVAPGHPLDPGQLPDSNSVGLAAQVRLAGGVTSMTTRCGDEALVLRRLLREAARSADLIVTTGGISAGQENDVVKAALSGDSVRFATVAVQPGAPQAAGVIDGVPFIGLPGNPVAALVSFAVFVRPLVHALRGLAVEPGRLLVELAEPVEPRRDKTRFVRARWAEMDHRWVAVPAAWQGSHLVAGMADTDLLLEIAAGVEVLPAGELVPALSLVAENDTPRKVRTTLAHHAVSP